MFCDYGCNTPVTTIGDLIESLQKFNPATPLRIFIDATESEHEYLSYVGSRYTLTQVGNDDKITLLIDAEIPFAKYTFNIDGKEITVFAKDYETACMRALQSMTTGESGDPKVMTLNEVAQQAQGDDIVALW